MINTICCTSVFVFHIISSQILALCTWTFQIQYYLGLSSMIYHEMKTPETSTEENYANIQVSHESKYFCKGNDR